MLRVPLKSAASMGVLIAASACVGVKMKAAVKIAKPLKGCASRAEDEFLHQQGTKADPRIA
jgi:hypothetical protein